MGVAACLSATGLCVDGASALSQSLLRRRQTLCRPGVCGRQISFLWTPGTRWRVWACLQSHALTWIPPSHALAMPRWLLVFFFFCLSAVPGREAATRAWRCGESPPHHAARPSQAPEAPQRVWCRGGRTVVSVECFEFCIGL